MSTPLCDILRRRIVAEGPISVAAYMSECLLHPEHGYYRRQEALGASGDFTTAPEISQMFGELLGLWAVDYWQRMGAPKRCYLVELGPGRGTLMRDALRAASAVPAFRAAIRPVLVETSQAMIERQRQALQGEDISWCGTLSSLPEDAPFIVLANEFLDALPIRQFQRGQGNAWHERCVGLSDIGNLEFQLAPHPLPLDEFLPAALQDAPPGAIVEMSPAVRALATEIAGRLLAQTGAALFVDYGYDRPGFGETFQAVRRHAYVDPLAEPGLADLTAHVDFSAFAASGRRAGASVYGPVGQGAFLRALGIEQRAEKLQQAGTKVQRRNIDAALQRLTAAEAMGTLFKAIALTPPEAPQPAGFA